MGSARRDAGSADGGRRSRAEWGRERPLGVGRPALFCLLFNNTHRAGREVASAATYSCAARGGASGGDWRGPAAGRLSFFARPRRL